MNNRRLLDIHCPNRNLVSFLIHICYEAELRSQLSKFNIKFCDNFDPLDPSIIHDPTFVNEPIDSKLKRTRKTFHYRIGTALQQCRTPIYNAVANFFVHSGFINLEDLAPYGLVRQYKYRAGHILDHV